MPVSVCLSVRLSVMEVHWHIIANLGFKFRSKFNACARMHAHPHALRVHVGTREGIIAGKSGGIISLYASNCLALLFCFWKSIGNLEHPFNGRLSRTTQVIDWLIDI